MIKYYINNVTKVPYKLDKGYVFIHRSAYSNSFKSQQNGMWVPSVYIKNALQLKEHALLTEISEEEMTLLLLDRSP